MKQKVVFWVHHVSLQKAARLCWFSAADLGAIPTFIVDLLLVRSHQSGHTSRVIPVGSHQSGHTSDLKMGATVATLPGTWRYRVSAWTGWPGVSIL